MLNIKKLYDIVEDENIHGFDTLEGQVLCDNFINKYLNPIEKEKGSEELNNIIYVERRNAFKNGFKTAVSLLLDTH